jgi:hypothetical protein
MPIEKKPSSTPRRKPTNPTGKNQYANDRGKMLGCRLPLEVEKKFLAKIQAEEITVTEAICQSIALWLESK